MSVVLRKRPPSSGGTPTEPSSSKKQRFIDAVKMLLDIAKESSDAFPPLKSCLGGINALIKHYDEYNDVKDKLNDLVPWLKKLQQSLAKVNPDDNREEVERRSQLAKSLEDIGKRSLTLSEKGKVARALDKRQDSQEVIKLVEKLRQAILEYQVSQQQSIYNQVVQLTSSFDVLLKLHQKTPAKNKIESVRARLDRLGVQGDTPRNADELRRRKRLFEVLEEIKDKLQLLSERPGAADYVENEGDVTAACDLADDLRDAIVEYQFAQQKAIYEQNCGLIDTAELSVLNGCRRAGGVEFRHGDRQGCLKGTRDAVLDDIESWSKDYNMSPVYWLNGLAGTGKSTIAQTIAERIFADGRLGASFFCSRDFKDRRDLRYIFPTLAFQLAHKYPKFRSILVPLLQSNPDIVHESLYNQMEALIVRPLSLSDISTVIIIDALDECVDKDPQSAILSVMGRLVEGIPDVKFLITGRPEPRIQSGFRLELLRPLTDVFVLHEVEPSVVNTDIRLFLEHGLSELAKRRGIERGGWPTDQHIDLLCMRADGLFVYAVATLKFLDHAFTPPSKQLDIITNSPENTTHEGSVEVRPSTTLDSLYIASFQDAFERMNADDDVKVGFVIGTVVLAMNPLPPSAIATLVELENQEVMDILRLIHSLLKLSEDPDFPVLPFHKSFPDFITDPLRCPNERFHISPRVGHLRLALNCLKLMNGSLGQNFLSLPDYSLNSEIEDLQTRKEDRLGVALEYACKSWHSHLIEARGDVSAVISTLRSFLQEGFLAWLEVLSVIGAARDAVIALENLVFWLQEVARDHQLLDTARDYFHFATTFFEVIDVSATHIYHSALELSPLSSTVRAFYYYQRPCASPRVVVGVPDSWDPSTAVSTKHSYYLSSVWSPCGQFVATSAMGAVEIRDAHTLEVLSTPQPAKVGTRFRHGLAYSPDGCSLAGCSDTAIVIWDTQTGGMVKAIKCEVPVDGLELLWSSDGTTIGAVTPRVSETVTVHTYDVVSGTTRPTGTLQSRNKPYLWTHDTSFRLATTTEWDDGWRINIFQVGSILTKIESFPLRFHSSPGQFSPTTYRTSISVLVTGDRNHEAELLVVDVRSSEVLLRERDRCRNPSFSPDGTFFAAFTGDRLIVWKYTSGRYARWKDFGQTPASLQFSPNSSSILGRTGALLHVLHLDYSPSPLAVKPVIPARSIPRDAYSPHGTYIATTRRGERAITITDLRPQNPSSSQFIDTDFEISEIVLTGNVLLAKGSDTVVAWLLTEEGMVGGIFDGRRADRRDSLWDMSPGDATADSRDRNPSFWGRLLQRDRGKRDGDDRLEFSVEDGVGAVGNLNGFDMRIYNAGTGEILESDKKPLHPGRTWYRFQNTHRDDCDLYHRSLRENRETLEYDWPVSRTTLREGWVKDPEGRHRLWLHARWRSVGNDVEWLDKVTTMRLKNSSEFVIVKF